MKKIKINEYLSIKEASWLLGISKNTLINWQKKGKIKVYINPFNKYRLYSKEDIKNILRKITKVLLWSHSN